MGWVGRPRTQEKGKARCGGPGEKRRKAEGRKSGPGWELKQAEEGYGQGALNDARSWIRVTVRRCMQPRAQRELAERGRKQ